MLHPVSRCIIEQLAESCLRLFESSCTACLQAYYRRADAKLALGRFSQALKDFKLAAKVAPRDPDLKRKLAECEKESQRLRFEKALRSGELRLRFGAAASTS